jgi:sterol desaturase/sphingolipid hydroxylase (fatty acid hydroxylase superfamily)
VKKYPSYITLVWIALGVFVAAYSFKLGVGNLRSPGPGFFPCLLGEFMAHAKATDKDKEAVPTEEGMPSRVSKLVSIALTLLAYALLLEWLGYIIVTFLAMILLLRFSGYTSWMRIIAYSVIIAGVSYFIFHYLGVMFPPGVLRYLGLY